MVEENKYAYMIFYCKIYAHAHITLCLGGARKKLRYAFTCIVYGRVYSSSDSVLFGQCGRLCAGVAVYFIPRNFYPAG